MKRAFFVLSLIIILVVSTSAFGTPLRLDYEVTDRGNGLFDYVFELVLDNNDGKWDANDGWGWIIFGDTAGKLSPLTDFVFTSAIPAPFTGTLISSGGHNGPTFTPLTSLWVPTGINDSISWAGYSKADLAQGELLFSTLQSTPGAKKANFEEAWRPPANMAEPATFLLMGFGLLGLVGFSRRKFK